MQLQNLISYKYFYPRENTSKHPITQYTNISSVRNRVCIINITLLSNVNLLNTSWEREREVNPELSLRHLKTFS